jgi:type I restriction-modification system DNA methylase subunit
MASKYDDLSATSALEQTVAADLAAGLVPRGATVLHHGSATMSAPGGRSDIEVRDPANGRLLLVEVTRRTGSAADGEFIAIADHLDRAVSAGGYASYGCLFVSPATSARMSANLLERNRQREQDHKAGRFVAIDFAGLELLQRTYRETDPALYPLTRVGELLDRWSDAVDDARSRRLLAEVLFAEDEVLHQDLTEEMRRIDAEREQRLKRDVEALENKLRDRGITGNAANSTLIYLTFLRLYEEKRNRETGQGNRFTRAGFDKWAEEQSARTRAEFPGRFVQALLGEIALDHDLAAAEVLARQDLPPGVDDAMVRDLVLPVFDEYNFYAPSVDVLGVVFETLARRGEKDTRVGQFFTPQAVVDFAADLIQVRPNDVVLDPAVGTARFLIAAMGRQLARIESSSKPPAEAERDIKHKQLLGADIDPWVSTIAKMNMYIHGDGKSSMVQGNGLALADRAVFATFPDGVAGGVDIVLTNPPLGNTSYRVALEYWKARADSPVSESDELAFYRGLGVVPVRVSPTAAAGGSSVTGERMKGGALFLGAIAQYLKRERSPGDRLESRGGRAIVVVDEAILNTPEYAPVRAFIRRAYFVKAVVSLGRAAFQYLAHTDAKTSILYLIRKPNDELVQREPIFFAHAEAVGYSRTGKWIGSELGRVFADYTAVATAIGESYIGDRFREDAFGRAVSKLGGHRTAWHVRLPSGEDTDRLDFFDARYRDIVARMIRAGVDLVPLADLIAVHAAPSPEASRTGEYEFATVDRTTGQVRPKGVQQVGYAPSDLWVVRDGDMVVSGIDVVHGAVALAGADVDGLVMSKEMFAYRARPEADVNLGYVVEMLRTPAARDLLFGMVTGTSNRTRVTDPEQLLALPVPRPPARAVQDALASHRQDANRLRSSASEAAHRASEAAAVGWAVEVGPAIADEGERVEGLERDSLGVAEGRA